MGLLRCGLNPKPEVSRGFTRGDKWQLVVVVIVVLAERAGEGTCCSVATRVSEMGRHMIASYRRGMDEVPSDSFFVWCFKQEVGFLNA